MFFRKIAENIFELGNLKNFGGAENLVRKP